MGNKKDQFDPSDPSTSQSLRQRAEEALQKQPAPAADVPLTEAQDLIHELRVHQIQLEMQNEHLHQAQEQLEASRGRYADLYDFAPVGYFTLGTSGLILEANLTGAAMLGIDRGRLLNKPLTRFIFTEDQDIYYHYRKQLLDTGDSQACELRMTRQQGLWFYARLEGAPAQDQRGTVVHRVVITNINQRMRAEQQKDAAREELQTINQQLYDTVDELKETQEKMMQQERLAAVGQLAAGIAHDFNNILTVILSYVELMQLSPHTPDALQPDLKKISAAGQRAAHLVRQLLDFSRKSIRQTRLLDLASVIMESVNFLERTIPENIQIRLKIIPGDYQIHADAVQLHQLITNLAVNARDAMPAGGKLDLGLAQIEAADEEKCTTCDQIVQGRWICFTVADTGSGMTTDTLSHIFEPFFTTKATGAGTGLGLSQVYGIIKQHDGHVMVTSQVEQGTTITMYLPPASDLEQNELIADELSLRTRRARARRFC